jgi:tRNA-2-methylthio-N6-dimethylallyladenosine synthase
MFQEITKENQKRENPILKVEGGKKEKIVVGITGCMVRKTGMNEKYLGSENTREAAKKIELIQDEKGIYNHDDKLFPRLKELDFTLRIEEVKYVTHILSKIYNEPIGQDHKFDDYLKQAQLRENPAQVQIIIQTGCDNYCTFCIVPYTRGKEISRQKEEILEEVKIAVKNGAKEMNLV